MNDTAFIAGYLNKEAGWAGDVWRGLGSSASNVDFNAPQRGRITTDPNFQRIESSRPSVPGSLDYLRKKTGIPGERFISQQRTYAEEKAEQLAQKTLADVPGRIAEGGKQLMGGLKGGLMKYGPAIGGGLGLLLLLLMSRNKQPQQMMGAMPRGWQPYPQLMPARGAWQRGY